MHLRSTLVGIAASALVLLLLAVARLVVVKVDVPDLEIREIELSTAEPEPPPPPPEEPPPHAPPPPPALTDVPDIPDPTRVPVPKAEVPMDVTLPVDPFFTDLAPAPLPQPALATSRPAPQAAPKPSSRPGPPVKSPPPAPAKSHYQVNELDGVPRLIRRGSTTFPTSLSRKGVTRGTVVLEVEISASGAVVVRNVVSSTHPELIPAARRVATGSRYTPPTRQGQPVRAIWRLPITITSPK